MALNFKQLITFAREFVLSVNLYFMSLVLLHEFFLQETKNLHNTEGSLNFEGVPRVAYKVLRYTQSTRLSR